MDTAKTKEKPHVHWCECQRRLKLTIKERKTQVKKEVERLKSIGAREQKEWEENGQFWVVLLDPEENECCLQ